MQGKLDIKASVNKIASAISDFYIRSNDGSDTKQIRNDAIDKMVKTANNFILKKKNGLNASSMKNMIGVRKQVYELLSKRLLKHLGNDMFYEGLE